MRLLPLIFLLATGCRSLGTREQCETEFAKPSALVSQENTDKFRGDCFRCVEAGHKYLPASYACEKPLQGDQIAAAPAAQPPAPAKEQGPRDIFGQPITEQPTSSERRSASPARNDPPPQSAPQSPPAPPPPAPPPPRVEPAAAPPAKGVAERAPTETCRDFVRRHFGDDAKFEESVCGNCALAGQKFRAYPGTPKPEARCEKK